MKTLITLNIGLTTTGGNRLDIHRALSACYACGISITASSVVNGEWEGKPEPCLFVQGFVQDPHGVAFRAQLWLASVLLSQHVIALFVDGKGELVGPNPEGWEFDSSLFHFHAEPIRKEFDPMDLEGYSKEERAAIVLRKHYASVNTSREGATIERIAADLGIILQP